MITSSYENIGINKFKCNCNKLYKNPIFNFYSLRRK